MTGQEIAGSGRHPGNYASDADATNATLVLLHPIGNDANCWQFLGLENAHSIEFPGHGRRERQPGWTHASFADEVVASFDGMLDLVGMSMGGTVVANILARHPHRVRSAVIACSGSVGRASTSKEAQEAKRRTVLGRGERGLNGGMACILDETLERWFTPLAVRTRHRGVEYARRTLLQMDPAAWYDVWSAQANSEYLPVEALTSIKAPVTIIGGLHDRTAGLDGLAEVHRMIPNSRYEIIAGPHMMHLDQPKSLLGALERHLVWAPIGNRVEAPIGAFVYSDTDLLRKGA